MALRLRDSSLTLLLLILRHHLHHRLGRCRRVLRFAAEEDYCLFGFGGDDFVGFGIRILFACMHTHMGKRPNRPNVQRTRRLTLHAWSRRSLVDRLIDGSAAIRINATTGARKSGFSSFSRDSSVVLQGVRRLVCQL